MNRVLVISLSLFIISIAHARQQVIPRKPDHVSEADYRNGVLILKNAYQQVEEDDFKIVAHDYWNFAVAYHKMGQPKESVYNYLFKARYTDKNDFCSIVNVTQAKGIESSGFYKLLGEEYRQLVADCAGISAEDQFDVDRYISANKFDKELIYRLNVLLEEDQKFRKKGDDTKTEQQKRDRENIKEAIAILDKYGYPGKTKAGDRFASVVWIVIQHAELEFQEKYLPVIVRAVREKELEKAPLRMLLDRIYSKKERVQLFGSQIGVPFADDATIAKVKSDYGL